MIKGIDKDFYKHMATKIFNKPLEEITEEERNYTKRKLFGMMYNAGNYNKEKFSKGDT